MSELECTKQTPRAIPVQAKERIEFVDILRGFALFGVLAVNMTGFAGQSLDFRQLTSAISRAAVLLIQFLLQAKFYTMFSFLFGWGMSMQMRRAEVKGARFTPVYLRRLIILLIFGVLHSILLWDGDILTAYALLGFVLLLFRKRSPRVVLAAVAIALLFRFVLAAPGAALDTVRTWWKNLTAFMHYNTYPESLYATGNFLDITRLRLQQYLGALSRILYYGDVSAMFLLGLYVGKRRIFQQIDRHLSLVRWVMWIGLAVGAILNGIFISTNVWPTWVPQAYRMFVAVGSRTIGAPALMLFYVSAIILLTRKESWYQRLAPLANLGRSALSNYLLQSVICSLIFYGYGLGLYGEVSPAWGLVLTLVIYYAQVQLSEWWLDRYQFGPMEWLWRTLTYGRRQPLRCGETYDDLKPLPWLQQARRLVASVDLRIVLVSIWAVLLLSVGGLVFWYLRLEGGISEVSLEIPLIGGKATVTPIAAPGDSESESSSGAIATPQVQPVAYNPGPIAASGDLLALASTFDAELVFAQIEILTGPPYLGRYAGSSEGWAAGDYIAQQFAGYGLQPAGDDGTFFQPFPVENITLAQLPNLVVEGPDGTVYDRYVLHQDFSPIARWYSGSGTADGEVVWASDCTHDDFAPLEVEGKVVLCRAGYAQIAGRYALEHGAAGLLLLTDPQRRPPDFGNTYFEAWVPEPIPTFRVFPTVADELLLDSGKSVEDLTISFTPFYLPTQARMEVTTIGPEACPGEECRGRNVLGVIPGRDPEYADQVVIIGAHYDHLGQAPDGTAWVGANDNASGVAVLLEIAHSWHEQGYVPRHTVLFAAWDAEEIGLVGSRYYVEHPRYPLENTVAKIQLDMVGAGGDTLLIDGGGELGEQLRSVADGLGIETEITNFGRSDHAPFLAVGIPANLLIWHFEDDATPQYHRPMDTPEIIELDKLEAVGKIVGITALGLTEGEPAIADLLARRAAAVGAGDLEAFLATSLPAQEAADRFWFADAQALSPTRFEMRATDVRVLGRTATAMVQMTLERPVEGGESETRVNTASLDARFVHDGAGWRWAGPNLVWADQETGFALAYPSEKEGLDGLGQLAAERYAEIAALLGLPAEPDAALMVLPNPKSLQASTALSLTRGQDVWVGPGVVKLAYSKEISSSQRLADALAQLVLAEAGVTESAAPWLWQGLPLALRAQTDVAETKAENLPRLKRALATETIIPNETTSRATVDYLRQRVGWQGVGRFITTLGQACHDGLCGDTDGVNLALLDAIQMDSVAFEAAWRTHWQECLATAEANLDDVLAARTEAVWTGDKVVFLNTVDPDVPNLMTEEQHWFADLANYHLESFFLTGEPLALLEDGSFLANVTLEYRLGGLSGRRSEATVPLTVLFTPENGSHRWAGVPFETLQSDRVNILYPEGQAELAQALLEEAETIYPQLATEMGVEEPDAMTIKLHKNDEAFRTSVLLSFPSVNWLPAWTGKGESVKLRWQKRATLENYRPALAVQLARNLLYQIGVESEWLIKGVSIYLSRNFDGGVTERAAAANLEKVLRAIKKEKLDGLKDMLPDHELSKEGLDRANTQAWDAVRYLVYAHGWEALLDLLQSQGQGFDPDAAFQSAITQSASQFEAAWSESIARAHALPEWIEIAWAFDPDRAYEHVEVLARPELAGRQAGSPGAQTASAYIAANFAEIGLSPVGEADTFLQRFPISYTTLLAAPQLEIVGENGQTLEAFVWQEGFLTLLGETAGGGSAAGELVWIQDQDYQGMELDGKIVVRRPSNAIDVEMAQAVEHGASGLILVRNRKGRLAKKPLPVEFPSGETIPVLELTQKGFGRLMEVTGQTQASLQNSPLALPLGLKARIKIPLSIPETVEAVNVLGLLPGSDPVLGREVIILGAHYDHVGDDPDIVVCPAGSSGTNCERVEGRRYTGANDDASGVGVLLEIARLWHETGYRPQRSVLFAAWGAQEPGQIGSSYYVEHPVFPLEETVAMLQLDAVGGGSGYFLEAQGTREREGLLRFSMMAAENWIDGRLILSSRVAESDQAPFREAGVSALLLTWRGASKDNWPVEFADEVEPYRLSVTGRMVTLALMTIAR